MADSAFQVALLGHSFVKRVGLHISSTSYVNFGLPAVSHKVFVQGRGGAHILDTMDLFFKIPGNTDLLLIDIGTNDLCNSRAPAHTLAVQTFNLAKRLIDRHGVKHVVLFQVLPRTPGGKHGKGPAFTERADRYNRMLQSLIFQHRDQLPISYWFHKGFITNINDIISDGVHLNSKGMTKYIKSVRRAIIHFSRKLRAVTTH